MAKYYADVFKSLGYPLLYLIILKYYMNSPTIEISTPFIMKRRGANYLILMLC